MTLTDKLCGWLMDAALVFLFSLILLFACCGRAKAAEPGPKAVAVALALSAAEPTGPAPRPVEKTRAVAAALAMTCPCGDGGCKPNAATEKRLADLEKKVADVLKRFSEPVPQPMPAGKPPTDAERFDRLKVSVAAGQPVQLSVGLPAGTAYVHETFPAGFLGMRPGVYDCFLQNGEPYMKNRDGGPTFGPLVTTPAAPPVYHYFRPSGGCPGGQCPVPN